MLLQWVLRRLRRQDINIMDPFSNVQGLSDAIPISMKRLLLEKNSNENTHSFIKTSMTTLPKLVGLVHEGEDNA